MPSGFLNTNPNCRGATPDWKHYDFYAKIHRQKNLPEMKKVTDSYPITTDVALVTFKNSFLSKHNFSLLTSTALFNLYSNISLLKIVLIY